MDCEHEAIQRGSIGIAIERTIREKNSLGIWVIRDVSAATSVAIRLKDPSGEIRNFAADFTTDGTDGNVVFTTSAATDLDISGRWTAQFLLTFGSTVLRTSKFHFDVETPL